jgi:hypothetical protein
LDLLASLVSRSLCERKWDQAHADQQKQVKRAPNKMCFGRGCDFTFHVCELPFNFSPPVDSIWQGRRF